MYEIFSKKMPDSAQIGCTYFPKQVHRDRVPTSEMGGCIFAMSFPLIFQDNQENDDIT